MKNKRIVVVGNGPVTSAAGESIDAADWVIRFNHCASFGPAGTRTDVIAVCNTGNTGRSIAADRKWREMEPVAMASEIWCVRDPAKLAAMQPAITAAHPELSDFADDHTGAFKEIAEQSGKSLHAVNAAIHEAVDRELMRFGAKDYVIASSGLLVIFEVLEKLAGRDTSLEIAGFGHSGWEHHPFAAEKKLVDDLVSKGRLMRIL